MSDLKAKEPDDFTLHLAIGLWMVGVTSFCAGFGFDSWKFMVVGSSCWMLAGMILIASAADSSL